MARKFKIGQKVTMSKGIAKFILSDYGQDSCIPLSGKHSERTEFEHDCQTILAMLVLMNDKPIGTIVDEHWPDSHLHNYKVEFDVGYGPFYINLQPCDLDWLKNGGHNVAMGR